MTILQLITRRQYRGAEVFAAQLGGILIKKGVRIVFAGLYAPPEKVLEPEGADILDLSNKKNGSSLISLTLMRRIARVVKKNRVDIVQANASDNLKYAVLSKKLFRWKAPIVYRNASIASAWIKNPLHKKINRWLLMQTDAIACVSKASLNDMHLQFKIPKSKLHYIPNGTPLAECMEPSEAIQKIKALIPEVEPNALLIFHIGAFTWEKNHEGLLRIFENTVSQINQPLHLICIGSGPLLPVIDAQIKEKNLEKKMHLLGYREDVPDLLAAANLLVLPSLLEGLPGVLLEAGSHGLPFMAYDVGAVNECFPEELKDRFLISPRDEAGFSNQISAALTSENLSQTGQVFKQFIQSHYDINQIVASFENLYESCLSL